jgi:serine/threonine-protein kinase
MLSPGQEVDRFEVVELLGVGGIAEVYKVRHRVLNSMHALKVVTAGGPAVARRLLREGSIQAQLRHPNLVGVTDVIEVNGHSALVLEYVEGITLQGLLHQKGALPQDEALALFSQVLAGVAAAHAAGVLHRDLKPGNILLAPSPMGVMAKVTDFGLAKMLLDDASAGEGDTIQGLVMGTPGYMAPEQAGAASTADARADVFALGVMLYEMLTGVAPFTRPQVSATLKATLLGEHTPLAEAAPQLPGALCDTVERCLGVDRLTRFADAHELARALFGDRPELAEIVSGSRPAVPLAISLPSLMPLRAGGMGSAHLGANPTMAPAGAALAALDAATPPRAATPNLAGLTPPASTWASIGAGATPGMEGGPLTIAAGDIASVDAPPRRAGAIVGIGLVVLLALGAAAWTLRPTGAPDAPVVAAADPTTAPSVAPAVAPGVAGVNAAISGSAAPDGAAPGVTPGGVAPGAPGVGVGGAPPAPRTAASGATPAAGATASSTPSTPPAAPTAADVGVAPVAPAPSEPAPVAVEPVVADAAPVTAAAVAASAVASPDATLARLTGTWEGTWAGRPFTVAIERAGGPRVTAKLDVLVGTSYRSFRLAGTLDAATGRITAAEDATPGWWLDGKLDGDRLAGSIRHPDQKKASSYTAKRR